MPYIQISLHCRGKHLLSPADADRFSDTHLERPPPPTPCPPPARPPFTALSVTDREERSDVHWLRHLSIVWKNLPPLTSLFFYCTPNSPRAESCAAILRLVDGSKKRLGLTLRTLFFFFLVLQLCRITVRLQLERQKGRRVRLLLTVRSFVAWRRNSISEETQC